MRCTVSRKQEHPTLLFKREPRLKALSQWDDVLKYMRGEVKLDDLPKALRLSSRAIRKMIDDQTKELTAYHQRHERQR